MTLSKHKWMPLKQTSFKMNKTKTTALKKNKTKQTAEFLMRQGRAGDTEVSFK